MKKIISLCCACLIAPITVLACDSCKLSKPAPGQRVVEYDLHISETRQSPAGS